MLNFKTLVATATILLTSSAFALEKTIDVIAYSKKGGNTYRLTEQVVTGLEQAGWKVNFVKLPNSGALQKHASKNFNQNPGVYFSSDASINENSLKGVDVKPKPGNFVASMFSRRNAVCGPKGTTVEDFKRDIASGKTIKVSSSNFYPAKVVEAMGDNFAHVLYYSTSKATAGMLAGDADYLFSGMTKGLLGKPELSCFAAGSSESGTVEGMVPFKTLLPGFEYSDLNVNYFLAGVNLTPELRDALAADAKKMLEQDGWKDYVTKSKFISATEINMTEDQILNSVERWKP